MSLNSSKKDINLPLLKHRHAPIPATMVHEMKISLAQAEKIRWIIKTASRNELLNESAFPNTVRKFNPDYDNEVRLVLLAINETVEGKGILTHSFNSNTNQITLHHIKTENPKQRSIGFNSDSCHFYLRSEMEILETVSRIAQKNVFVSNDCHLEHSI